MISLFASSLFAQGTEESPELGMTFQAWKDQQILESQNEMLRISARISQLKASGKSSGASAKGGKPQVPSSSRVKALEADPLTLAERDLRRTQERLVTANNLQLSDYVLVYLPSIQDQPEVIESLTNRLSKEELSEILRFILTKNSRIDTKRNTAILSTLPNPSSRSN